MPPLFLAAPTSGGEGRARVGGVVGWGGRLGFPMPPQSESTLEVLPTADLLQRNMIKCRIHRSSAWSPPKPPSPVNTAEFDSPCSKGSQQGAVQTLKSTASTHTCWNLNFLHRGRRNEASRGEAKSRSARWVNGLGWGWLALPRRAAVTPAQTTEVSWSWGGGGGGMAQITTIGKKIPIKRWYRLSIIQRAPAIKRASSWSDQGKTKQQHARVRSFRGSTDCLGFRLGHADAVVGEIRDGYHSLYEPWTVARSCSMCHSNKARERQSEILILRYYTTMWGDQGFKGCMHTQDSDPVAVEWLRTTCSPMS
jgi:hypothetical protein